MVTQYEITGTNAKGIAASIERGVTDGALAPGSSLPPVRTLAERLGVSPGTVATTYKELRRRGIVVTRGRGGTVVAEAPAVASRRPPKVPEGLRDLAGGHPDPAFLPEPVPPVQVARGARSHRAAPRLARLEELTRAWYERDGVPSAHVTFAHSALDCVARLLSTELRPGDAVAMEDPGYHHLLDLVPALGLRIVPVGVDDEGMRPEELRAAVRGGVRAVICSPRAQNPYGGCFSAARRDALAAVLAEAPEVLVVENDYTAEICGAPLHSLTAGGRLARWAQVRTVTKHLGPDLRWAALACDATTLARHDGRLLLTSGWVSHVLQEAVAGLLTDPGARALVGEARTAYAVRREALIGELARRGISAHGSGGLNVWVPVRDEAAVVNGLRSSGWWVAAGARFRIGTAPGVRITTADLSPVEAERLAADFAAVLGEAQATYGG
ncbi:aminotransferase class I/II-fold pyridoxal phosphate-dependent enzyme [Streptomyces rectiverticillatus]|uniref:aminotransferase class I/II-fold pyridoxal phosphate-dependent enzyme n=1 Tax=Streptomyces rectiverticillatus TaxID=173860 RepID=UPI0015C3FFAD|nr:aminotransferase class I/II-fold pyridoxal phosphate-dependent enzyme [Streptomyces rectiverticillatus]QLE71017.1 aminotransferase class I/II-fold pyridoxal phosphate-dependent enzyme [Streptomyces rectiverticillatus]